MKRKRSVKQRPARPPAGATARKPGRAPRGQAAAPARRSPGRPRSTRAHEAILGAAVALTREIGYDAVTMDGIAARAGVGKATLYRRWKGKETLVAEAVGAIVRRMTSPDTGTVEGDLLLLLRGDAMLYADPATRILLSGLVAAMARSAPIADAVRSAFIAPRQASLRRALERGVARGELRRGLDLDLAVDLINGTFLHRYLIGGGEVDERLARALVKVVIRGLAP